MVSREIGAVAAIAIAVGLGGAWAGLRVVEGMVYGVTIHHGAFRLSGASGEPDPALH